MSNMPPPPPGGPPSGPPPGAPPPPPGMPAPPPGQGGPQLYQPPPPSYGAPPPIAQPQYGHPQYGGAKTNTLAIISLVASLVWVCGLGSIAAVITGFMARKQIRQSGGTQTGGGMAGAGVVIGGPRGGRPSPWVPLRPISRGPTDTHTVGPPPPALH